MVVISNDYLTLEQMKENAITIHAYLITRGWSLNAIAGMLGNMETESTINPGLWQNRDEGNLSLGFGLVQWTPATKYFDWVDTQPGGVRASIEWQLNRIDYEMLEGLQWISTSAYPLSFEDFSRSTQSPEYLAQAFLRNYERPANPNQPIRSTQARFWFDYLKYYDTLDFAQFPMDVIIITQGEDGSYSHKGTLCMDFVGTHTLYPYGAPCKVICRATIPSLGVVIWSTVDKVYCADGVLRHFTFSCIHEDVIWQTVGMVLEKGDHMGQTGTAGHATGDHLHLQVIDGNRYLGFTTNSWGSSTLVGTQLHIYDVFSTGGVAIREGMGYDWKVYEGGWIPPAPDPEFEDALIPMLLSKALNGW